MVAITQIRHDHQSKVDSSLNTHMTWCVVCVGAGGVLVDHVWSRCNRFILHSPFGFLVTRTWAGGENSNICVSAVDVSAEIFLVFDLLCMKCAASVADPWSMVKYEMCLHLFCSPFLVCQILACIVVGRLIIRIMY